MICFLLFASIDVACNFNYICIQHDVLPSLEYIEQNLDRWNFPPKRSQLRGVASVTPTPEGKIHKSVTPTWETGSPDFISPPWPA